MHPARQGQRLGEALAQGGVSTDLAADVAHHPPEIGAQRPQGAPGALELPGMGMALMADQRALADPLVGLTQRHAMLVGQRHQPLTGSVQQLGIGGEAHRLRLHGGVDNDAGEVGRLGGPAANSQAQALLQQHRQLLFPSSDLSIELRSTEPLVSLAQPAPCRSGRRNAHGTPCTDSVAGAFVLRHGRCG